VGIDWMRQCGDMLGVSVWGYIECANVGMDWVC
jgi:hypothetical protein